MALNCVQQLAATAFRSSRSIGKAGKFLIAGAIDALRAD
jgi:hypothetical protein